MAVLLKLVNDAQMLMSLLALIFTLVCVLKERRVTGEELERASMRSMSWPTD